MAQPEKLEVAQRAVVLAHAAEFAERYDDMAKYMRERVEAGGALHPEERDLLAAAYKGALQRRRNAWRVACAVEKSEAAAGRKKHAQYAASYRNKVETELQGICGGVVGLLQEHLLLKAEAGEPKAFYLKMQADYYRYAAEFTKNANAREKAATLANMTYQSALEESNHHLLTTHPVRLQLALNYAVFQHEVLGEADAAIATAQTALADCMRDLEGMPEEVFQETGHTLQMLRDNLLLWMPPSVP